MNANDYISFRNDLIIFKQFYKADCNLDEDKTRFMFNLFANYEFKKVTSALRYFMLTSPTEPSFQSLCEYMRLDGMSKSEAESKASYLWQRISINYSSSADYVFGDLKASLAFFITCGTHEKYGMTQDTDEPFLKKEFVKNYVNCPLYSMLDEAKRYSVQTSRYRANPQRCVFIGEHDSCLALANQFYGAGNFTEWEMTVQSEAADTPKAQNIISFEEQKKNITEVISVLEKNGEGA